MKFKEYLYFRNLSKNIETLSFTAILLEREVTDMYTARIFKPSESDIDITIEKLNKFRNILIKNIERDFKDGYERLIKNEPDALQNLQEMPTSNIKDCIALSRRIFEIACFIKRHTNIPAFCHVLMGKISLAETLIVMVFTLVTLTIIHFI